MALHSACYFLGMGVGPILYGFGFLKLGIMPTLSVSAVLIVLLGVFCSRYMRVGAAPV